MRLNDPTAMTFRIIAATVAVLLGHVCQAQPKDMITWGLVNFDPKNTSRSDLARTLIQEKLDRYTHDTVAAPIPRIVNEIKSGAHWCWAGAIRTEEREGFSTLSIPFIVTFPQRIMVLKERRAQLLARGSLSLEALLQDRNMRTGITRSRTYSPEIDALFTRYPPQQYTSSIPEAIQMLLAGRLDYVVEDAGVAVAHARQQGREDDLVALSFKEMAGYVLGRVMCPKNDWGKRVVADINVVLNGERATPRYRLVVEAFRNEDDRHTLRQIYDDVFLKSQ